MKFFTFSGIDGSGKTTQLSLIIERLQEKNYKVKTFHLIQFSFANKIREIFSRKQESASSAVTKASRTSILLRKFFIVIDVLRFIAYFNKLQKSGYDILITDRYFYDQIVNVLFLEKVYDISVFPFWARIALFFMKKPTKSFYIDVSPMTALSREKHLEQDINYLKNKKILFDLLSPRWKMIKIDGNKDVQTINQFILKSL